MTRKIITTLIADVTAALPDNNTQQIAPADVRQSLLDMIDSMTPSTAFVSGTSGPGLSIPLTTAVIKIPAAFYNSSLSGNTAWMEGRLGTDGDIISHTAIGRVQMNFDATITTTAGTDIAFTVGLNGVPILSRTIVSGQGAGNPVSASFSWMFTNLAANDVFDLRVSALAGTPSILLFGAALKAILLPQFIP